MTTNAIQSVVSRRDCLAAGVTIACAPATMHLPSIREADLSQSVANPSLLPATAAFAPTDLTYLDNGSQHPISLNAKAALDRYIAKRMLDPLVRNDSLDQDGLLVKFARLINADVSEVTYVQSTTAAEQMIIRALGLPRSGGHIVTDTLHFFGSIPLYEELGMRGCEVTWLRPVNGRIRIEDMRSAVRKGTRLVALSLVSTINGFQQDLRQVCDIAHAAGALVYADIIHAAGCIPLDVKASGVDFAACATYKWLMGDFGLGFLYVRKDVLPRLERTNFGYYGIADIATHAYPLDPPGTTIADYRFRDDATGAFALGTHGHTNIAMLHASLDLIERLGVASIQTHAQGLIDHLKREVPKRGYPSMTPPEARTPIATFVLANARDRLTKPLAMAGVKITLSSNRFRLTPSIQNTEADIERFLRALPKPS